MKFRNLIERAFIFICIASVIISAAGCADKPPVEKIRQSTQETTQISGLSQMKRDTIKSKLLKKDMKINVYLPKGYNGINKYPVLYMIHGYGDNEDKWYNLGLTQKADELINNKGIVPIIIAMPSIENSYGLNSAQKPEVINKNNMGMYEDYICKEVIGYIDSTYSTDTSREARFIGGLSMGGYTALHLAFAHTDLFSKVGGHSPAIWINSKDTGFMMNWLYPTVEDRKQRDPLELAKEKDLSKLMVYLDCGDQDDYGFYEGSRQLYEILKSKGSSVEYYSTPGNHSDQYWKANLEKYLKFYASR